MAVIHASGARAEDFDFISLACRRSCVMSPIAIVSKGRLYIVDWRAAMGGNPLWRKYAIETEVDRRGHSPRFLSNRLQKSYKTVHSTNKPLPKNVHNPE